MPFLFFILTWLLTASCSASLNSQTSAANRQDQNNLQPNQPVSSANYGSQTMSSGNHTLIFTATAQSMPNMHSDHYQLSALDQKR